MSLITPDFGLLFWMVLIFGIVFFVLAKFGFPVITSMVQKRSDHIAESLRKAQEAQDKLEGLAAEQTKMMEQTRLEQKRILKEASQARDNIIASARQQAQEEAAKMIEQAKTAIAAERETALQEICRQVSLVSVQVAEKIVRKDLDVTGEQLALIDRMVDEASKANVKN